MQDKITLDKIKLLHPKIKDEVVLIYNEICLALNGKAICRFTHTYRSIDEQNKLYAKGRTEAGKIVTKAKGGYSYHNYGLAIDIVLLKDTDGNGSKETASYEQKIDFDGDGKADWMEVVDIFKKYGYEWGGEWAFKDVPHFQKTFGFKIKDLQLNYKNKNFIEGTNYLNI